MNIGINFKSMSNQKCISEFPDEHFAALDSVIMKNQCFF